MPETHSTDCPCWVCINIKLRAAADVPWSRWCFSHALTCGAKDFACQEGKGTASLMYNQRTANARRADFLNEVKTQGRYEKDMDPNA